MIDFFEDEDVKPREGLYVAAMFDADTQRNVDAWLKRQNVPNAVAGASLHTTIVYSRVPVQFEPKHTVDVEINTAYSNLEVWDTNSGHTLVLHFFSPYLHIRFHEAMAAGATYDFDEYKPHVTLSYDVGPDFDLTTLEPIDFPLNIIGEYSEVLDIND